MRHQNFLCVFTLFLFFLVSPALASDDHNFYNAGFLTFNEAEWSQFLNEEEAFQAGERGVSLKFAQPDRDSGLKFFLTNEDRNDFSDDVPMDELNDISPAAGIRFSVKLKP